LIVLDASVTMAWSFSDESTAAIDALFERVAYDGAVAPVLWPLEVANSLRTAVRKGRVDETRKSKMLQAISDLGVRIDGETADRAWTDIVMLSDRHDLTVYDASYLELAVRLSLPVATLDNEIIAAARAAGVEVLP
jgi:predicted nucleic acid-binding protein